MAGSVPDAPIAGGMSVHGSQGGMDGVAYHIWDARYRHDGDRSFAESLQWVARALASAEDDRRPLWEACFLEIMREGRFLPAGRILAGAGTGRRVTLANCFVMGVIEDSIHGMGLRGCTAFRPTGVRGKDALLRNEACRGRPQMTGCSG